MKNRLNRPFLAAGILLIISTLGAFKGYSQCLPGTRPNFLICISDDQSWLHTSISGISQVKTPNFDRVAKEGILFREAYCAASSCTPSRSAILTGRNVYELEEGAILSSYLPPTFDTYQDLLESAGYMVGFTGKGTKPALHTLGGRTRDPAGPEYSRLKVSDQPSSISSVDYAGNFEEFLSLRQKNQPFSFWMGTFEPHRPYEYGVGLKNGLDTAEVVVPDFLPDVSIQGKMNLNDYLYEIQYFDNQLGKMLDVLEQAGELDNTIIIVTSDNGMPFARAKTELYEYGVHIPLAIRWGSGITASGRESSDFISLKDIAPTILEAAGVEKPTDMSAVSFLDVLQAPLHAPRKPNRTHCFVASERHATEKRPRRGVYTDQFAYIYNYPCCLDWPVSSDSIWDVNSYSAVKDTIPYYTLLSRFRHHPRIEKYWEWYRGPRKEHELYDRLNDPFQLNNLAYDPNYSHLVDSLSRMVNAYSKLTNDPRISNPDTSIFDTYTFYSRSWKKTNKNLVDQDRNIMFILGSGKRPGELILPPYYSANSLTLTGRGGSHSNNFSGLLSWNNPLISKDITRYKISFFNRDQQELVPTVGEVCAGTNQFPLPELLSIPENAFYIGLVSVNDGGEYYDSESMIALPYLSERRVFPQPTQGPFSLSISTVPNAEIIWEIIDSQGRLLSTNSRQSNDFNYVIKDDLTGFASGIYFMRVKWGRNMKTYRVVKN